MPIYEYRCECGAIFESLESVGSTRAHCAEQCQQAKRAATPAAAIAPGHGRVERLVSASGIRGDGHEAKEAVFDTVKRANRPGCDDCGADN